MRLLASEMRSGRFVSGAWPQRTGDAAESAHSGREARQATAERTEVSERRLDPSSVFEQLAPEHAAALEQLNRTKALPTNGLVPQARSGAATRRHQLVTVAHELQRAVRSHRGSRRPIDALRRRAIRPDPPRSSLRWYSSGALAIPAMPRKPHNPHGACIHCPSLQRLPLPFRDLVRVDVELPGQLRDRLVLAQGRANHPRRVLCHKPPSLPCLRLVSFPGFPGPYCPHTIPPYTRAQFLGTSSAQ